MESAFSGKSARALYVMLAALALPYLVPGAEALRVGRFPWQDEPAEDDDAPAAEASAPSAQEEPPAEVGELTLKATENRSANALPAQPLDAAALAAAAPAEGMFLHRPQAMSGFYNKLRALEAGAEGVVRIAYFGDSIVTSDYITGTARRLLQQRFGDGGHGLICVANPWEWYFHNDVTRGASAGFRASRINGPLAKDGDYGPTGVVFRAAAGASAYFATAKDGEYGRKVARFDLLYAQAPDGGALLLSTGEQQREIDTRAELPAPQLVRLEVPDGEARLSLKVVRGQVKLYGVALERERGLVLDALGVLGARARTWNQLDAERLRQVFALRPPHLIAIQLGTNESEDGGVNVERYKATLRELLDRFAHAAPEASILLVAPPDRAERHRGTLRSNRTLVRIVELQRALAEERNVAFFDMFSAMGGPGSMARWLQTKPQLASADLTHPTSAGAEALGRLLVSGIEAGYAQSAP